VRAGVAAAWLIAIVAFEIWSPRWNREWITMGPYLYFTKYHRQIELMGENVEEEFRKSSELIYYREDVSTTVSVRKEVTGDLTLQVNGKTDASTGGDMMTQELLAHVPLLLHPDPRDVLVVGLASGVTVGSAQTYPIERVTVIEISPAMVQACALFSAFNGNAMADPRFDLRIDDGRNYMLLSPETYDVIISEPSNPWISGIGSLFTREYFELLHERLGPDGIACVWLQAYGLEPDDFRMIVRTVREAFPTVSLWESAIGYDYLLIGQKVPFALDYAALEGKFGIEAVRADLARVGIDSPVEFLKFMAAGPDGLADYAGHGVLHTDDNSRLEFSGPRSLYENTSARQLDDLSRHRENALAYLTGSLPEAEEGAFDAIARARALAMEAAKAQSEGDAAGADNLFRTALMVHSGEEEASEALVRLYSNQIVSLLREQNWEGVETIGKAMLALDPKSLAALDGLSISLVQRESFVESVPILEEAVRYFPDYAPFHARLGYAYAKLGQSEQAIAAYEEAVARDGENAQYAYDLGVLYLSAGKPTDAAEEFGRAVAIRPRFVEAYINLGGSMARLGRLEEARQAFVKVLDIDPANEIAQRNLSKLAARQ
jgi:spermidine synthase